MIMKAMIFAAGLGTRLKPITDTLPKALVPVGGKPLLEHVCRKLMASGVNESVVNVHHFADMVEEWAEEQEWIVTEADTWAGMTREERDGMMFMEFSDERRMLLETGGGILNARKCLEGCGSFLIHNVDILSNADLKKLAGQVKPDALATLLVSERKATRYFLFHPETMRLAGWLNAKTDECVMVDPNVRRDECKMLGFSGIHVLSDKVFGLMDEYAAGIEQLEDGSVGMKFSIKDFYLWAASGHPVYGVVSDGLNILDVGKLDSIEMAENMIFL